MRPSKPRVSSWESNNRQLDIVGKSARRPFSVIRMKERGRRKIPGRLPPLFKTKADVIEPVGIKTFATRSEYSNHLRNEVQNLAELPLLFSDLVFGALAIGYVLDSTEHLVGSARSISFHIAQKVGNAHFAGWPDHATFGVEAGPSAESLFQEAHKKVVQMVLPSEFPEKLKTRGVTAMA